MVDISKYNYSLGCAEHFDRAVHLPTLRDSFNFHDYSESVDLFLEARLKGTASRVKNRRRAHEIRRWNPKVKHADIGGWASTPTRRL